ncbi:TPA: hypothetical protein R8G79_004209 [Citrobacter amalonaticus]|nr:hypothetical protein [Citrobacter amalonaticus]
MYHLTIYIWDGESDNVYHLLDYVQHCGEQHVSLFFLRKKNAQLAQMKNVYVFDYPERITAEWINGIHNIAQKMNAVSVRIHSLIKASATINLPLIQAFQPEIANGVRVALFLYERDFNDIAWRQEFNNLLNKGLRVSEHINRLKNAITRQNGEWHAVWHYLLGSVVETHYLFHDLYKNNHTSFFSSSRFGYLSQQHQQFDHAQKMKLLSLLGVNNNTLDLVKQICAQKQSLFFIDDGADYPLGEQDKDACLLQDLLAQKTECVFLINYTGNIDAQRYPGMTFIRLPDTVTPELLALMGIVPLQIFGVCSLSLFAFNDDRLKKVFFHEHKQFADNIRLRHFLRAHYQHPFVCHYLNETLNRLEENNTEAHFFSIGESMGDALFAIGSLNALRDELSGQFILLAPAIYHQLLALCPYVDAVWDREQLEPSMKEAIYMATVQGCYHQPCSGKHIFATKHQIDSILDTYPKRHFPPQKKEIVLSLDSIDKRNVDRFLRDNHLMNNVVLIHPNEGVPNRTWPQASWEALIERFVQDGWSVVLIGANTNFYSHKKTVEIENKRVFNAIDQFSMGETVYLMTRASLLVACDSGPVALAAATDIAICALYSVVPGEYRLPFRHGVAGWNALAVNLSCQHTHCAKDYPRDTRGTFDAWCPNDKSYACIRQYSVDDFYQGITQFLHSQKYIRRSSDEIMSIQ